jgi:hypothetical protein
MHAKQYQFSVTDLHHTSYYKLTVSIHFLRVFRIFAFMLTSIHEKSVKHSQQYVPRDPVMDYPTYTVECTLSNVCAGQ